MSEAIVILDLREVKNRNELVRSDDCRSIFHTLHWTQVPLGPYQYQPRWEPGYEEVAQYYEDLLKYIESNYAG